MIPVSSMLICDRWRSRTFRGCLWLELADYDHIRFTTALQVRAISRTCTSWYATVATMNVFLCTSKHHKRRQVRCFNCLLQIETMGGQIITAISDQFMER